MLDQVAGSDPPIHRATVYRTLEGLTAAGVLRHVHLDRGLTAYHLVDAPEPVGDHDHHDDHLHAQCSECGRVTDLPAEVLGETAERIRHASGFRLDASHVALSAAARMRDEGPPVARHHSGHLSITRLGCALVEYVADRASPGGLGREWLLHGHLQDRVGMALVMEVASREQMQDVAIEEWMAASPVYSRRMQRAMSFPGDGVDTIMKNLQLDIGAPHEFMDFRYRLVDADHGEFWLAHCGALMDVEPMGADYVHGMCHAIEDPTFDATAGATNPRAQVRPIHRPPRVPAGRTPHCHWRIDVVAGEQQVVPHPNQALVEASLLAQSEVATAPAAGAVGGRDDYSGDFDPDFRLEDLSLTALQTVLPEFALQSQLLLRSFLLSVMQRFGIDAVRSIVPRLLAGWGGLTAQRLRDAFELPPTAAGLKTMLDLHPCFAPRHYIAMTTIADAEDGVRLAFGDCPAAHEGDELTWFGALGGSADDALDQIVQAFDPRASACRWPRGEGELVAYRATIDPAAEPAAGVAELADCEDQHRVPGSDSAVAARLRASQTLV